MPGAGAKLTCHIVCIWLKKVPYLSPEGRVRGLAVCEVKPRICPKPSPKADFSVWVYSHNLRPKDLSQGSEGADTMAARAAMSQVYITQAVVAPLTTPDVA